MTGIVSPAFSALYDGDGLRAMKQGTLPGGTSAITPYFLYGPDGMPIVEEGWNGTSASVTAANGMGAAGWRERYAGSQKTAYADDPSGSVLARVTAGDTTSPADSYSFYDGYGDVRGYVQVSTGQRLVVRDPVGFGSQYGYYTDPETGNGTTAPGLLCLTHRYYDPGTGRFVTRDPSGYGGGVNLYGFAGDNPVNESDPSGFDPEKGNDGWDTAGDVANVAGLIPVLGIPADAASAGISWHQHDWWGVGLSLGAMIPFIGDGFDGVKITRRGVKVVEDIGEESEAVSLRSRRQAFTLAKDRAGIPRSASPTRQWAVGEDVTRLRTKNYRFSTDEGTHGRYYEYDTPQGQRVIAEHLNDGPPHFHAGQPKDPSLPTDFQKERYQQMGGHHHIYYQP